VDFLPPGVNIGVVILSMIVAGILFIRSQSKGAPAP
jgi:hypothetical protein